MTISIRTEHSKDYPQVHFLNFIAFGNRQDETRIVERIRKSSYFVRDLALVAEEDGEIVGQMMMSKAKVVDGNQSQEVIVLAPIAVIPPKQKQGIGKLLINEGIKRCKEYGFDVIFVIGHPTYYPQFGFKPARPYGVDVKQFEVSDDDFMVCELTENALDSIKGELVYPNSFFE
ncbi:GNAT family N-acetyltransferase [Cohnella mopanensis]|uniref:GNAT family N-acetyltransferase n=1 Tax=Cohnella mopanensis TaxID=2911966 RepID=UPI001EF7B01E|nr:N-acetyltransferase [Cohnella mopanensis]